MLSHPVGCKAGGAFIVLSQERIHCDGGKLAVCKSEKSRQVHERHTAMHSSSLSFFNVAYFVRSGSRSASADFVYGDARKL